MSSAAHEPSPVISEAARPPGWHPDPDSTAATERGSRRHDLDALRGWAMLLGIVLHASMSFFPAPWAVQDTRQSGLFGLLFVAIHGFRMPLFFLLSGYFTLLVCRRKGLGGLLWQRTLRILVPCLLGLVTVLPALHAISGWAMRRAPRRPSVPLPALFEAIRRDQPQSVRELLQAGTRTDEPDPVFQIMPLHWAALTGNTEIATALLDAGAPLERGDGQGHVPLNAAAFAGHAEVIELLLARGADPNTLSQEGRPPISAADDPLDFTLGVFDFLGLPRPPREQVRAGRQRAHELLDPLTSPATSTDTSKQVGKAVGSAPEGKEGLVSSYTRWLRSDRWQRVWWGRPLHLVTTSVFDHLWFLWFLCWLVVLFAVVAVCGGWRPGGLTSGGDWTLGCVLAATILPQAFMNPDRPGFGPDTATGWIIPPHLLAYYGLFFFAGCLMLDNAVQFRRWTRRWPACLAISLLLLLPLGLSLMELRGLSAVVQTAYAWLMSFACLGWFEQCQSQPSRRIRYLSDSSYWLYVAHMPVVVALQSLVAPWNAPPFLKFSLVLLVAIPLLLLSYHLLVRPTPLGWLLNGRREPVWQRPPPESAPRAD